MRAKQNRGRGRKNCLASERLILGLMLIISMVVLIGPSIGDVEFGSIATDFSSFGGAVISGFEGNVLTGANVLGTSGLGISALPVVSSLVLTTSGGNNYASENLTATWTVSDGDSNPVKNITTWNLSGKSFTLLTVPFETDGLDNVTNYVDGSSGTVQGGIYNPGGGYDGWGAFEFDGGSEAADQINFSDVDLSHVGYSIEVWAKFNDNTGQQPILALNTPFTSDELLIGIDNNDFDTGNITFGVYNSTWQEVSSTTLPNVGDWYHIIAVQNDTHKVIYINGQNEGTTAEVSVPLKTTLSIGKRKYTNLNFNGTVDELKIYNYSLSAEQASALYQNKTGLIVSQETSVDDVWSVCVTPNDGISDGTEVCSSDLTILATPSCGDTITVDTTLGINLTGCTGDGIVVGASNIVLDCAGYTITGDGGATDAGVGSNAGDSNVTVKNCIIENFGIGIIFDNSDNSTMFNNTIQHVNIGGAGATIISFSNGTNANISSNTIYNITADAGGGPIGISFSEGASGTSANGIIYGNNISLFSGDGNNNALAIDIGDDTVGTLVNALVMENVVDSMNCTNPDYGMPPNDCGTFEGGIGIRVRSGDGINVTENNISNTGTAIVANNHSLFINKNLINGNNYSAHTGSPGMGPGLWNGYNHTVWENNTFVGNVKGIYILGDTFNNTFLNNNFSGDTQSILDIGTEVNYLIYNNSLGEISWDGLLNMNLTADLSHGVNLFIGNNTAAFNSSVATNFNGSANVTLRTLALTSISEIRKWGEFSTNSTEIISNGSDCIAGGSCNNLSYAGGVLLFNTTNFSSFSANSVLACGDTITSSTTITANLSGCSADGLIIGANDITLDCAGYMINYSASASGDGVDNSGGYSGVTIKNCLIISGSSTANDGVNLGNAINNIVENNTINTAGGAARGVLLSFSNDTTVRNNNITVTGSTGGGILAAASSNNTIYENSIVSQGTYGIQMQSTTDNNLIWNNNISDTDNATIIDTTGTTSTNILIYNNSFGQINWTKTDLSTNISLAIGDTIFLEDNLTGLTDNNLALELNGTAVIELRGLPYVSEPYLLKDGLRCDNGDDCNTTYGGGILSANISSFSNYTTTTGYFCGTTITLDATLTSDLNGCPGDGIVIGASNIILDCAGFTIRGDGGATDAGVASNAGDNNVTVKNCVIENFGIGIIFDDSDNSTIFNNTIQHVNIGGAGATIISFSNGTNANISSNTVYNITADAGGGPIGISFSEGAGGTSANGIIYGNNVSLFSGDGNNDALAIDIGDDTVGTLVNALVMENVVDSMNCTNPDYGMPPNDCGTFEGGIGIRVRSGDGINVTENNISNTGTAIVANNHSVFINKNRIEGNNYSAHTGSPVGPGTWNGYNHTVWENNTFTGNVKGIYILGDTFNHTFLNNNFSGDTQSIFDRSTEVNYLIYNNSLGEISWDGLLNMNLTADLSHGVNLFIGNNTAAFNSSIAANFNGSANVTLRTLALTSISEIRKWGEFSTNSTEIISNGSDCIAGGSCNNLSYAGGVLLFNTTNFSSFSANEVAATDSTAPTFENLVNTSLNFRRYQNFTANITINDTGNVSGYIFSTNATGTWSNDSFVAVSGTSYNASVDKNISLAKNGEICWYYWANDSVDNNASSSTECFTVQNTIPGVATISMEPTSPVTANDLYCNVTTNSSDVDGDIVNYTYVWIMNGVENLTSGPTGEVFDSLNNSNTSKGEVWNCTVVPFDGDANGTNSTSSLTIANTAPTAVNLTLVSNDSLNRTNGTLIGNWSISDGDGDGQTDNETLWFNGSVTVSGLENFSSIASGNVSEGDTWILSVRVYDGTDWSSWVNTSSLTVLDVTAPNVTLSFGSITASSSVMSVTVDESATCNYTGAGSGDLGSGTSFSQTLSSLNASSEYNLTVYCNDSSGNKGNGTGSFNTTAAAAATTEESTASSSSGGGSSKITCFKDEDCGKDGYVGEKFCGINGVYRVYESWTCTGAGKYGAKCESNEEDKLIEGCDNGCSGEICLGAPLEEEKSGEGVEGFVEEEAEGRLSLAGKAFWDNLGVVVGDLTEVWIGLIVLILLVFVGMYAYQKRSVLERFVVYIGEGLRAAVLFVPWFVGFIGREIKLVFRRKERKVVVGTAGAAGRIVVWLKWTMTSLLKGVLWPFRIVKEGSGFVSKKTTRAAKKASRKTMVTSAEIAGKAAVGVKWSLKSLLKGMLWPFRMIVLLGEVIARGTYHLARKVVVGIGQGMGHLVVGINFVVERMAESLRWRRESARSERELAAKEVSRAVRKTSGKVVVSVGHGMGPLVVGFRFAVKRWVESLKWRRESARSERGLAAKEVSRAVRKTSGKVVVSTAEIAGKAAVGVKWSLKSLLKGMLWPFRMIVLLGEVIARGTYHLARKVVVSVARFLGKLRSFEIELGAGTKKFFRGLFKGVKKLGKGIKGIGIWLIVLIIGFLDLVYSAPIKIVNLIVKSKEEKERKEREIAVSKIMSEMRSKGVALAEKIIELSGRGLLKREVREYLIEEGWDKKVVDQYIKEFYTKKKVERIKKSKLEKKLDWVDQELKRVGSGDLGVKVAEEKYQPIKPKLKKIKEIEIKPFGRKVSVGAKKRLEKELRYLEEEKRRLNLGVVEEGGKVPVVVKLKKRKLEEVKPFGKKNIAIKKLKREEEFLEKELAKLEMHTVKTNQKEKVVVDISKPKSKIKKNFGKKEDKEKLKREKYWVEEILKRL